MPNATACRSSAELGWRDGGGYFRDHAFPLVPRKHLPRRRLCDGQRLLGLAHFRLSLGLLLRGLTRFILRSAARVVGLPLRLRFGG